MRHPLNAVIALLCLIISFLPLSALSRPLRLPIDQRPIPSEGSFHIPIHQRDSIPLDSLTPAQLSSKLGSLLSAAGKKYGFIIPAQGLNVRKRGLPKGFVQMGAEVQDYTYFASVAIGTPPVAFNLILDTGSSDLIVAAAPCNSGCYPDSPLYQSGQSSTSVVTTQYVNNRYNSGSGGGFLVSDIVSFGGFSLKQSFAALNTADNILIQQGAVSGILGLAFSQIAQTGAVPFVQALYNNKMLNQPLFAMALAKQSDYYNVQAGGIMTVGDVNTTLFTGNIVYTPLDTTYNPGFWAIPLDATSVGGKVLPGLSKNSVLIDSGTTLIVLPTAVAAQIYAAIPGGGTLQGNGLYTYNCPQTVAFAFTFSGVVYTVSENEFNLGATGDGRTCYGAIAPSSDPRWIIGDRFVRGFYTVYNFGSSSNGASIGFAQLSNPAALKSGFVPLSNGTLASAEGGNSTQSAYRAPAVAGNSMSTTLPSSSTSTLARMSTTTQSFTTTTTQSASISTKTATTTTTQSALTATITQLGPTVISTFKLATTTTTQSLPSQTMTVTKSGMVATTTTTAVGTTTQTGSPSTTTAFISKMFTTTVVSVTTLTLNAAAANSKTTTTVTAQQQAQAKANNNAVAPGPATVTFTVTSPAKTVFVKIAGTPTSVSTLISTKVVTITTSSTTSRITSSSVPNSKIFAALVVSPKFVSVKII